MERKKQIDKAVRATGIHLKDKMKEYNTQRKPTKDLRNRVINELLEKCMGSIKLAVKKICYMVAKTNTKLIQNYKNALLEQCRKIDRELDKGVK